MSKKIDIPPKQTLEEKYKIPGTTISSLAREYNTSNPTVRSWLKFYNIEIKSQKDASTEANRRNMVTVMPYKDVLIDDLNNLSIDQIELKYKVGQSTVYEWIKFYNIEHGTLSDRIKSYKARRRYNLCDHSKFLDDYQKYKNIQSAADSNNISYSFAKTLLKEYNVEIISGNVSNLHQKLIDFCIENGWNYKVNDRTIISPLELDLVIEDSLAIEICGLIWHSETFGKKDKFYHLNKMKMCNDKDIRLITMFYHYDIGIIKSMILNHFGKNKRIYARKTKFIEISYEFCKYFEDANHIMGSRPASRYFGLYYKDELVQTFTLGKSRYNKKYEYELIRCTTKKGYNIIGGLSKLLKHSLEITQCKSLITYVDLSYGTKKGYSNIMNYVRNTDPNYWYFNPKNSEKVYSRVAFQKHKLEKKLDIFDPSLNEYKNMVANGWDRYWDCGNAVYEWIK